VIVIVISMSKKRWSVFEKKKPGMTPQKELATKTKVARFFRKKIER